MCSITERQITQILSSSKITRILSHNCVGQNLGLSHLSVSQSCNENVILATVLLWSLGSASKLIQLLAEFNSLWSIHSQRELLYKVYIREGSNFVIHLRTLPTTHDLLEKI